MTGVLRKFPYREIGNPPILRPVLDVVLKGSWGTQALVDTGSPLTIFDRGTADALNLHVGSAGARTGSVKLLGATWMVQHEYVTLCLAADTEYTWDASVAFVMSPELQMPFQGLLGTVGFLDKWNVTFNVYYGYFVIERPDDWHARVGQQLDDDLLQEQAQDPNWHQPG